jgi:hypothetical protein
MQPYLLPWVRVLLLIRDIRRQIAREGWWN